MYKLTPGTLTLDNLQHCLNTNESLYLSDDAWLNVAKSAERVSKAVASGQTHYGINTGFGALATETISSDQLQQLQKNIVLSHACGVGDYLPNSTVKLILLLKINALAQGYSGIQKDTLNALLILYNKQAYPCIPSKGSVGASGDLAPLAYIAAALMGEGYIYYKNKTLPAKKALKSLKLKPLNFAPKEGLALLNGTQVSTALALEAVCKTRGLFEHAIKIGALSVDAVKGSVAPFTSCLHDVRRQVGQITVAQKLRHYLKGSEILTSHQNCNRVQDPYSIRCQPQVMGACLDQIAFVEQTLVREANAVTDNPLVFCDEDIILSGGNFHAEPVAFAADNLALAISEIGALSERRLALLLDPNLSGLPPFLIRDSGLNSGFMIAQVTAAALASENKSLAHPASVDSLPTSANQEDHVSMATFGARRLHEMLENTKHILIIELLAAAQGVEMHRPLATSPELETLLGEVRRIVPGITQDTFMHEHIHALCEEFDLFKCGD